MDNYPSDGGRPVAGLQAEELRKATRDQMTACLGKLAQQRDRSLFSELFRYFAPRVKSYLMRLGLSDAQADELAQEAMLAVWNKAHLFRPERASAGTWIFTLSRNLFIDLKRRERQTLVSLLEEAPELSEPGGGNQAVLETRIARAISTLPAAQAQVVHMSYFEGRSHSEIAQRLDIPLGSVKSRMRLAFAKLRGQLS